MLKNLKMKQIASAVLLMASLSSHAALTTLTPADGWPPLGSTGLQDVLFNVSSGGGVKVATGAHNYKEGALMANDGVDKFYANPGFSPNPNTSFARWSYDYVVNYGTGKLGDYVTTFSFDIDPTDGVSYFNTSFSSANCGAIPTAGGPVSICGLSVLADSQNPVFVYAQLALLGSGFTFDPTAVGNYGFKVSVTAPNSTSFGAVSSAITVDVPEPASLALVGLGLAAAGFARCRRA